MYNISIISSSVRTDRKSHHVALYFQKYLIENKLANVSILDLKEYDFPIFEDKFSVMKKPSKNIIDFRNKIVASDGIIIVTPEYNGSFPASLKNAIDLLYEEWNHKPIAISTVSGGIYGGTQCLQALQFVLWKMKSWTMTATFLVSEVQKKYDDQGNSLNKVESDKFAAVFIKELIWGMNINKKT